MVPATTVPILIAILLLASYGLNYQLVRLAPYVVFRLLLLPGVAVHEFAHAIGCLVTATPIRSMNVWTDRGGELTHVKPRWPLVTQPVISLAPLIVGLAALITLSHDILESIAPWALRLVLIWLFGSIGATLTPSKQDLKVSLTGIMALGIVATGIFIIRPATINTLSNLLTNLTAPLEALDLLIVGGVVVLALIRWLLKR